MLVGADVASEETLAAGPCLFKRAKELEAARQAPHVMKAIAGIRGHEGIVHSCPGNHREERT
jgi:hypothetical protein